jgi:anthranilate phosphoribosyltransferase
MADILAGRAGDARIAGLVVALAAKGETVDELTGFASGMLEAAQGLTVDERAIDIVGTGGSAHRRAHALNVSTMACIVAAAAGAVVCKHGNRRASSTSGSFDFLEALGVAIELGPRQLEACVEEVGLGFAFARTFHPAMRFAGPVRAALGIPTVFNLLGPLAHPGRLTRQVIGVASPERAESLALVLRELGSTAAWVVAGADGLDELSTTGPSDIWEVADRGVRHHRLVATDLGLERVALGDLAGGDAEANADLFEGIVAGRAGPYRDIVVLNAGAGLVVGGVATTLGEGVEAARSALDDGRVEAKIQQLRAVTNRLVG